MIISKKHIVQSSMHGALLKKNALYCALFALIIPVPEYALSLGEMKVESALDQPFLGEIEFIDVHSALLTDVKVSLATQKSFERLGIVPSRILSLLKFEIKKNKQGRFVIRVFSTERISEPYIQLVVDLTWPKGELYKSYAIFLDPPGYNIEATGVQSSLVYHNKVLSSHYKKFTTNSGMSKTSSADKKNEKNYGPTVANENLWQIAQRYKTSETILPQVVLAIVGKNPDAFNEGNLNGLKIGAQLNIPPRDEIKKVPSDLATVEIMAHDKAWNEKTSINHVLSPPYINPQPVINNSLMISSNIAPVPKLTSKPVFPARLLLQRSMSGNGFSSIANGKPVNSEHGATLKAEGSITSAEIDSLKKSNAMLIEQIHEMQTANKKLQEQLEIRDKELQIIRKPIYQKNNLQTLIIH